ncbi:protein of unknown function [Nitrospira defluvii]|jgi:hypothetical protein|uniref:Uncharacterized protein n=1 Tax=Nitrospira defluvii TaxID=330214 RepID=D8PIH6_9BACT|nr:protein of unknown function [Nitrospira defluvii]
MKYLAQVRYVFPFRLGVPEAAFWMRTDGNGAFVRVWSAKADRQLILRDQKDRKPEHRREWLRSIIKPQDVVSRMVCINNDDDLFLEEVVDSVGFTRLDVTFEYLGETFPPEQPDQSKIREQAISIAQRFVRMYRLVANQVDVRVPNESDSPIVELRAGTEYSFSLNEIDAKLATVNRLFQWDLPSTSGAVKGILTEAKLTEFGNYLRQGSEPELYQQFLLEAKELSKVHGDHRLSVVVAQSAFEVYAQSRLIQECKLRNLRTLLSVRGESQDVDTSITDGDLRRELLGHYARCLAGQSVKECQEFHAWHKNAYILRNEIVHRGRHDVDQSHARVAFESVMSYCKYLNRMLVAGRNGPSAVAVEPKRFS